MGYTMPERPRFLEHALQGLAFWIGHRHSLFRSYPLPEGAIVAEACNLIQANLSDAFILRPECLYRCLVPEGKQINGVGALARADLVICSKEAREIPRNANLSTHVRFVIEVKRASASNTLLNGDLKRLYAFLTAAEGNARCFLFVVSESKAPSRFVKDGKSQLGPKTIPGGSGRFHVRRTVKAAASFSNKRTAHYVCLLEVFRDRPQKLPAI